MTGGLLSLLMATSLQLHMPSLPADGITWVLPIAPGHRLMFTLWTHDLAFSPQINTGGLTRQRPGPLRMTVWYKRPVAATYDRLGVVKIPAWPLVFAAAIMLGAGMWTWRRASFKP